MVPRCGFLNLSSSASVRARAATVCFQEQPEQETKTFRQMAFVILPNLTCSTRSKDCFSSLIRGRGAPDWISHLRQTTCGGFSLTFESRACYHAKLSQVVTCWRSHSGSGRHISSSPFFFLHAALTFIHTSPLQQ